ncbi:unnamed protein product [Gordionus sp. m RMFG-2023]
MIIQLGRGVYYPQSNILEGFFIQWYHYKNSIESDIKQASLVISHAGAGSIIEILEANKNLIVVLNENLMDNHQSELAEQLFNEKFLFYTTCHNLHPDIQKMDFEKLLPYKCGDSNLFSNFISEYFFT